MYVGDATWNKNLANLAKAIKIINVPCVFVGKVFDNFSKSVNQDIRSRESVKQSNALTDLLSQINRSTDSVNDNPWSTELRQFKQLINGDKRFIFYGYIDDYKLVKLYQQAKVNILVSRDEGFGFSYLEAAGLHCPSLLSDIPVLHEVSDNKGAIFADYNNPNDIANYIGEVFFNSKLRATLSDEAYQRSKYFNLERFKHSWLDITTI